jgi:ABC-type spermidine/putrescine transport system permease subunit I
MNRKLTKVLVAIMAVAAFLTPSLVGASTADTEIVAMATSSIAAAKPTILAVAALIIGLVVTVALINMVTNRIRRVASK